LKDKFMQNSIEEFYQIFEDEKIRMDDIELAEILWLAQQIKQNSYTKKPLLNKYKPLLDLCKLGFFKNKKLVISEPSDKKLLKIKESLPTLSFTNKNKKVEFIPLIATKDDTTKNLPFHIPINRYFHNDTKWIYALRHFKQKKITSHHTIFNEEQTADYIASNRIFNPQFTPHYEKRFEAVFIVELSNSMEIWQELIDEFFKSITYEDFRQVIKDTFTQKNTYSLIYRDYYFFPYDVAVISTLMFVLFLVLYFNLHHIDRMKNNLKCTHRSIVISRRLSNRFLGFLYAVFIWLMSTLIWEWIKYLLSKYIAGDAHYLYTIDVPYSYFWTLSDMIITIVAFVILSRYVLKYWAKLEVTSDALCIVGHRVKSISKKEIESIKVEPWNIVKSIKSYGMSILFWKPVLQISLKNGQLIYLRSRNAKHLAEDLKKCLSLY